MRRRSVHLLILCVATAATSLLLASPALAAGPTAVTVSGPGLAEPLTVRATDDAELFKDLLSEVDWLAGRQGNAPVPDATVLGPKYQVVVHVDDAPAQAYDVYPLAVGGPRVFRPAEQPKGKVAEAWLYGRVSMPETLFNAGVPLVPPSANQPGRAQVTGAGGQGGGAGSVDVGGVGSPQDAPGFGSVWQEWQKWMLLVGLGAVVLLFMLGSVSYLVRKGPAPRRGRL